MADDPFTLPDPGFGGQLPVDPLEEIAGVVRSWELDISREIDTRREDSTALFREFQERSSRALSQRGLAQRSELAGLEQRILRALDLTLEQQESGQRTLVDGLVTTTNALLDRIEASEAGTRGQLTGLVDEITGASAGQARALQEALEAAGAVQADRAEQVARDQTKALQRAVQGVSVDVGREVSALQGKLSSEVRGEVGKVAGEVAGLGARLTGKLDATVAAVEAQTDGIFGSVAQAGAAVSEQIDALAGSITGGLTELGKDWIGPLWEPLMEIIGLDSEEGRRQVAGAPDRVLAAMDPEGRFLLEEWTRVSRGLNLPEWLQALLGFLITVAAAPQTTLAILGKRAEKVLQAYALVSPWALLPVPDQVDAWKRGLQGLDDTLEAIQRQGYTGDAAKRAVALRRLIAPTGDQLDWWLRGFQDEERTRAELRGLGYDDADVERHMKAAFRPPPLGDLIRFAVREVFDPTQRAALDLDADYPEQLTQLAREQGLEERWARDYWAAHWELPSPRQGFEMLHRGVLTPEQLDGLLRALDVSPTWRSRLTAIAYAIPTRVDLRRMWAMGFLDEDGLVKGYRDLGYQEDDARRLAAFAMEERRAERAERESPLRGLTPAQMRAAVGGGLLSRDEAEGELEALGYTPRAADIFLALGSHGTPET